MLLSPVVLRAVVSGSLPTARLRSAMTGMTGPAPLLSLRRRVCAVLVVSFGRLLFGWHLGLGRALGFRRRVIAMAGVPVLRGVRGGPVLAVVRLRRLRRRRLCPAGPQREQRHHRERKRRGPQDARHGLLTWQHCHPLIVCK